MSHATRTRSLFALTGVWVSLTVALAVVGCLFALAAVASHDWHMLSTCILLTVANVTLTAFAVQGSGATYHRALRSERAHPRRRNLRLVRA